VRIEPDRDRISLLWAAFVPLYAPVDTEFLGRCELAVSWSKL
jgi:hypothetical protein